MVKKHAKWGGNEKKTEHKKSNICANVISTYKKKIVGRKHAKPESGGA